MSPESPIDQSKKRHLSLVPPIESNIPTKPRADGGNPLLMTPEDQKTAYESRDSSEWNTATPMRTDPNEVPTEVMSEDEFKARGGDTRTVINHPDNPNTPTI